MCIYVHYVLQLFCLRKLHIDILVHFLESKKERERVGFNHTICHQAD
jgi:hypothetical protein